MLPYLCLPAFPVRLTFSRRVFIIGLTMTTATVRSLAKGEILMHEMDTSQEAYGIQSGVLLVLKGDIIIGEVRPPGFVGEIGVILNKPRSTTVIARTAAVLDVFDLKKMLEDIQLESKTGIKFLKSLTDRLEMTRAKVEELQHLILKECAKKLAFLISEKRVKGRDVPFPAYQQLCHDVEVSIDQDLSHDDAIEDLEILHSIARRNEVDGPFVERMSTRFRSFTPIDLGPYAVPRLDTFLNFRDAAKSIAEHIVVLTRYLADYHTLGLSHIDSDISVIEEVLPLVQRQHLLKELLHEHKAKSDPETCSRQMREFDLAMQDIIASPNPQDQPLFPVAKRFGIGQTYIRALQMEWKNHLVRT